MSRVLVWAGGREYRVVVESSDQLDRLVERPWDVFGMVVEVEAAEDRRAWLNGRMLEGVAVGGRPQDSRGVTLVSPERLAALERVAEAARELDRWLPAVDLPGVGWPDRHQVKQAGRALRRALDQLERGSDG